MPLIHLTTLIDAPAQRVFDLSRSINLHTLSTRHTGEVAVGGVMNGLIGLNETVTFRARHLFKVRTHTSVISAMEAPVFFIDEMVKGDFKRFRHEHHYKPIDNGTIMIDLLDFESPYGIVGQCFDKFYLTGYLTDFLKKRNIVIKEYAESEKWKAVLSF